MNYVFGIICSQRWYIWPEKRRKIEPGLIAKRKFYRNTICLALNELFKEKEPTYILLDIENICGPWIAKYLFDKQIPYVIVCKKLAVDVAPKTRYWIKKAANIIYLPENMTIDGYSPKKKIADYIIDNTDKCIAFLDYTISSDIIVSRFISKKKETEQKEVVIQVI